MKIVDRAGHTDGIMADLEKNPALKSEANTGYLYNQHSCALLLVLILEKQSNNLIM
jgi:hypothetical protein